MAKIYSTDSLFDLDQLSLGNPITKSGGYFMKFLAGKNTPLYFQSPECYVKQGAMKSGKKLLFDLVFSNETDDVFLSWMESLEEKTRSILFQNRDKWFETPLDEHDIESSMMSPYKSYKSGKCYIVRAGVPMTLDKCDLKIYDESEKETEIANVVDGTRCLVIFEFRGIRCSVRSFQFEIEIKQMLLVKPSNLFDKCIVRSVVHSEQSPKKVNPSPSPSPLQTKENKNPLAETTDNNTLIPDPIDEAEAGYEPSEVVVPNDLTKMDKMVTKSDGPKPDPDRNEIEELDLGELTEKILEVESNVPIENIQLKPKNDIYLKLYREAREKAREAKMVALQNYLEAKRIKNTYFLEEMSESDEDMELASTDMVEK